ncbi:MAG: hypothetical protein KDD64_14085 [Bdellovibrionales bacterium]|nr:hypothetical protein [Bdellovibrionales bacterium]
MMHRINLFLLVLLTCTAAPLRAEKLIPTEQVSTYFRSLVAEPGDDLAFEADHLLNQYTSDALRAYQRQDFEACAQFVESGLAQTPLRERDRPLLLLALCRYEMGRIESAHNAALRSLHLRGSSSDALFVLGCLALGAKDFERAEEYLHEAVWFNRFHVFSKSRAFSKYGEALLGQDKREEAKRSLQEAQKPDSAEDTTPKSSPLLLAATYLDEGDYPSVIRILSSKRSEQENQEKSDADLGIQYLSNLFLAKALFETRTNDNPTGQLTKALEYLNRIKESPATPERRQAFLRLYLRVLVYLGKQEEAESTLALAQKEFPNDEIVTALRSQLELEREEREEAESAKSL